MNIIHVLLMQEVEEMVSNMKICRVKSGLTQKEAAELLGTTVQSYNRWENNPNGVRISEAIKIAKLFAVSLDYLFLSNT